MTVGHILAQKGRAVATVQPHATVRDVVEVLAAKHIGSIIVADIEGRMHGIVSERDVVRALATQGCDALDEAVSGIMTKDVETASEDDGILEVVGRMSRGRFRHMPVIADGRIAISGSVLFAFNSADLQPEGQQVLRSLATPLATYLASRDEVLMVSGFTDDRPVHEGNRRFADNWELSAQRALTVTRTLIEEGVPADSVFAAAFGEHQPVGSNADEEGRARNRRVEIAPVPRPVRTAGAADAD